MRYKGRVLGVGKSGEHTPWLNNHQDIRTYHLKVVGRARDLSACCVLLNKRCCCISGRREQRRVCGVCPRRRSGGQILSPAGAACFLLLFLCCMAVLRAVLCQCLTAGAEGRCGASASGEGQVAIAAGLISIPAVRTSRAPPVWSAALCPFRSWQLECRVLLKAWRACPYLGVSVMLRDE